MLRNPRLLSCSLAGCEHGATQSLVHVQPTPTHGFVHAPLVEYFFEQTMSSIEVAWQQGQVGVCLRQRTALVAPRSVEKPCGEGDLFFHNPGLVLAHKQESYDRVFEGSIVESLQDGAHAGFTAG